MSQASQYTARLETRVAGRVRSDQRLQAFLQSSESVLDTLDALYLVRGAVRDFWTGALPCDYDLMPAVEFAGLPELARQLGCDERTYFGGYRRRDANGLQIDLFLPCGSIAAHDSGALIQAMDTFAFTCEAVAYDLHSGVIVARSHAVNALCDGIFSIQNAFYEQARVNDLAYIGVKAIWIMGHCGLRIDDAQVPVLQQALALIGQGERRHVGAVIQRITAMGTEFLRSTPALYKAYRDAASEFAAGV